MLKIKLKFQEHYINANWFKKMLWEVYNKLNNMWRKVILMEDSSKWSIKYWKNILRKGFYYNVNQNKVWKKKKNISDLFAK